MNPAALALKNNRTAWVLYVVLMLVGAQSFLTISRLEYPEFTIRNAQIITEYPGRSARQVEAEVTRPLEQSIRKLAEVDTVRSTSKPGMSVISVEIDERYFELEDIWTDMRNVIASTRLPDGTAQPNVLDDFGDVFPYVFALKGSDYSPAELADVADKIRDRLLAVEGVAKVDLFGNQQERLYLEYSPSELAAHGISPQDVTGVLAAQNAVANSGSVKVGEERLNLVTLGEYESTDELMATRLAIPGQTTALRVSDLFQLKRATTDPARSWSHHDGERVVCIAASMVEGGVVTEIGEAIQAELSEIQQELPWGLDIETMFYQPQYVEKSVNDFLVNLGQAFVFVILVMLLFAGWRLALIVGFLVPSATLMCFVVMPAFGVALEMMSIAALIIALGLLVDNAVVVSEQILVRLSEGAGRFEAVSRSVKSLLIPLLAASATTIAAFSPVALAKGSTSEFTFSLFMVVSLALLASWLLSITMVPLLCHGFLKPLKKDTLIGRGLAKCYDPYETLLRRLFRLKWTYPIAILLLTVLAGWAFRFVPNIYFPPNERGQFVIDYTLPPGTGIEETERRIQELEQWLLDGKAGEVASVSSWIGNGGPRWYLALSPEPSNPNYGLLSVITKTEDPGEVAAMIDAVNRHAIATLPDAQVMAKALENGPPVGDPIQIRLYGKSMSTLYELRDRIAGEVKEIKGTHNIRDDWGAWQKQVHVDPDPVRAARLGLSTKSIAEGLKAQFSGLNATHYREEDKSIPVVMRSRDNYRLHPERLPDMPVYGAQGMAVPLGQVAEVGLDFLPSAILRENTVRVMTIKAAVRNRVANDAINEARDRIGKLTESGQWPRGYWIEFGGQQEDSAESQAKLGAAMPLSFSILCLILIAQFNSLRRFAIIACTIPPMLIGVVPGLLLTGSSFGFMTLLGLIALLGIIVNNAILLIDETNVQLDGGLELVEAVIAAARSRLRPILMTTMTTIIGLAPLAFGGGGMWSSMAFAMMFGLGFATFLTLLLCPVLFYLLFRGKQSATG